MAYNDSNVERTFNKDIAFLMEIQRLEFCSNNFAMEGSHDERLRALECWKSALSGMLSTEDMGELVKLKGRCKPVMNQGRRTFDVESINAFHEYLNQMNTKYKLQLGKRDSGVEAAKL